MGFSLCVQYRSFVRSLIHVLRHKTGKGAGWAPIIINYTTFERESQGGDCRINLDNYAANRGNIVEEEEEEESPFRIADIITANDNDDDDV